MRMSCNGCRVLRKGCNDSCTLRPCLQWIKNPDFQANATVFLAKFYGRAGLINLINAGPEHLRPAIFRSLLYEACGRIVNPIYGSAGLLWSGSWQLCQAAVEAVLSGAPIMQISAESAVSSMSPPLKAGDIRHVSKDENSAGSSHELHKVKSRGRFKRSSGKPRARVESAAEFDESAGVILSRCYKSELSRDSRVSHRGSRESGEADSMSVETVEASLVKPTRDGSDVELELTLGLEPIPKVQKACAVVREKEEMAGSEDDTCKVELALEYSG
ncbi:hypothetical protein PVL29_022157 [Vitis rotundifolia]|nr:hypothetical protein PVL29_022157 [Vitis rotundifolia]